MGIWWSVPKRKSFSRCCWWCVFKFLLRWWCVYGDVWIHSFQLFIGTESSAHSAVCKFLRVWWRWWSRVQWPQPRPESDDACANWGATFRYRKKMQKGNDLIINYSNAKIYIFKNVLTEDSSGLKYKFLLFNKKEALWTFTKAFPRFPSHPICSAECVCLILWPLCSTFSKFPKAWWRRVKFKTDEK